MLPGATAGTGGGDHAADLLEGLAPVDSGAGERLDAGRAGLHDLVELLVGDEVADLRGRGDVLVRPTAFFRRLDAGGHRDALPNGVSFAHVGCVVG